MYQAESWLNAYQYWTDILLQQQIILHILLIGSQEFKSYTIINQFIFSAFLFLLSINLQLQQLTTTNVFYYNQLEFCCKNPYGIKAYLW